VVSIQECMVEVSDTEALAVWVAEVCFLINV
jgi:hypothetical protein